MNNVSFDEYMIRIRIEKKIADDIFNEIGYTKGTLEIAKKMLQCVDNASIQKKVDFSNWEK